MDQLTNPGRHAAGHRAVSPWYELAPDTYLDHRQRGWRIAEGLGAVRYVPGAGVVLVHLARAPHVAAALGAGAQVPRADPLVVSPAAPLSGPVSRPIAVLATPASMAPAPAADTAPSRRDVLGWLGIAGGAAVFVAALAVPLDDPALVMALVMGLRGGRLILEVNG